MSETLESRAVEAMGNAWWEQVVLRQYGLRVTLLTLPGEYDLNFEACQDGIPTHILKVMRPGCARSLVEMQCEALDHVGRRDPTIPIPRVVRARDGQCFVTAADQQGAERLVWVTTVLPGRLYGQIRPQPLSLVRELGVALAKLDNALEDFDHPDLHRELKWDIRRSAWIRDHLDLIAGEKRRALIREIITTFETDHLSHLDSLAVAPIHNDANDYNLLVQSNEHGSRLSGIIDFGDMVAAPTVIELAVAGAYAVLNQERPVAALSELVAGYNSVRLLSDGEIALVYPLVRTRLAVSVANAALTKLEKPDDPYVTISERPAWNFLESSSNFAPEWVLACLRLACSLSGHPNGDRIRSWIAARRGQFAPMFAHSLAGAPLVDLSIDGSASPRDPLDLDLTALNQTIEAALAGAPIGLGRYGEPRLIYSAPEFRNGSHPASDRRTVHLGVDVFMAAGSEVRAPLEGIVHAVAIRPERLDYGGVMVLEHKTTDGDAFFTLFGHLATDVVGRLSPGQKVSAGAVIAVVGRPDENGGWAPHVHFQLGLTALGRGADWPGVADPDEAESWEALFPNGAALLNLEEEVVLASPVQTAALQSQRNKYFSSNLKLSYWRPITMLRGWKQFLFDQQGRPYLDGYNNVPHVGHCHPRVVTAAERQMRLLNTNTRYLHPLQVEYAQALTSKLPGELKACFLVNSGSEANELALRLARAHTGAIDTIVMDVGYHGNTNTAIDISAYKFNGPGGRGAPDWVHVTPLADPYRGMYKSSDPNAGRKYASHVGEAIKSVQERGRKVAAFICEVFPSVGGQIIPPPGYFRSVYELVRAAGGLCIADEVQTGLGRIGTDYWAFEAQQVIPDIVVLGKPIGNGHPMGAVITTPAIAKSFANGMEFFSTFGGSTLSCAVGREVLQVVHDEDLQSRAHHVGSFMLSELQKLKQEYALIGDVRGSGLFVGVEFVKDRESLEPATNEAAYIVNRLRDRRILIGSEGPFDNVLKIRPPLCFSREDASRVVECLAEILREDRCMV
jgi:4-aminobutyrate aminotransferase-like enzyme/Ser/Thr protein kinase RdoA (MazF antagonist)